MMFSTRELLLITVFLLATNFVCSQREHQGTQRYCGRNLVNVLTLVCDGIYNHMALQGHDSQARSSDSVFREKRSVASLFKGRSQRRRRRGAYEECCRKGCTIEEMVGYCGGSTSS